MVPSPPPRPSPDASSIPAPSVPKENSPCLENVTGGTGPSPRCWVLPARTVASHRHTLHRRVNHSPPAGVLRGQGGLSPSQRPLETSTFFYGCHKGYILIFTPAGFPPSLQRGLWPGEHLGIAALCTSSGLGRGEAKREGLFPRGRGWWYPTAWQRSRGGGWPQSLRVPMCRHGSGPRWMLQVRGC